MAWVTRQPVPDAGRVWAALSGVHQETGLIAFLLGSLPGYPARPWDDEEFDIPVDPSELDHMDSAQVLAEMWDGEMEDDEVKEDEEWIAMRAPFSVQFPGLALLVGLAGSAIAGNTAAWTVSSVPAPEGTTPGWMIGRLGVTDRSGCGLAELTVLQAVAALSRRRKNAVSAGCWTRSTGGSAWDRATRTRWCAT